MLLHIKWKSVCSSDYAAICNAVTQHIMLLELCESSIPSRKNESEDSFYILII